MFDILSKHITPNHKVAFIIDRGELENFWNWLFKNYNFTNTLSDFNDFKKHLKDWKKSIVLLDIADDRNIIYLSDYLAMEMYSDWGDWELIDTKPIFREEKIKSILD
jgi:hypothetical protein